MELILPPHPWSHSYCGPTHSTPAPRTALPLFSPSHTYPTNTHTHTPHTGAASGARRGAVPVWHAAGAGAPGGRRLGAHFPRGHPQPRRPHAARPQGRGLAGGVGGGRRRAAAAGSALCAQRHGAGDAQGSRAAQAGCVRGGVGAGWGSRGQAAAGLSSCASACASARFAHLYALLPAPPRPAPPAGQELRVLVGEPVVLDDLMAQALAGGWDESRLQVAIADRVGQVRRGRGPARRQRGWPGPCVHLTPAPPPPTLPRRRPSTPSRQSWRGWRWRMWRRSRVPLRCPSRKTRCCP